MILFNIQIGNYDLFIISYRIFNTLLRVNPHHLSAFNFTEHEYANHAKLKVVTGNILMRNVSSGAEATACLSPINPVCTRQQRHISRVPADGLHTFKGIGLLYHCHALILAAPLHLLMFGPQTERLTKHDKHLSGGGGEGGLFLKKYDIAWFKPPNGSIK